MKKNIVLFYGGDSEEHAISIRSAKNIAKNLDSELFTYAAIGIARSGAWYYTDQIIEENLSKIEDDYIVSVQMNGGKSDLLTKNGQVLKFDIAFPVLHGPNGEDGRIQGMLEMMKLPYVGVDVLSASMTMDKMICKVILRATGLPIVPFVHLFKADQGKVSFQKTVEKIKFPCIVKPVNLGSSIGVTKVEQKEDITEAIEKAFSYDNEVLIEEFIVGRELEIGVLAKDALNREPYVSDPGEIVMVKDYEFYDFESKYMDAEAVKIVIPADTPEKMINDMKTIALNTFKALKVRHFCRIDMFISETGQIYVNEVNAIPGFTDSSMFPSLCATVGFNYQALLTHIIGLV